MVSRNGTGAIHLNLSAQLAQPLEITIGDQVIQASTQVAPNTLGRARKLLQRYTEALDGDYEWTDTDSNQLAEVAAEMLGVTFNDAMGFGDAVCVEVLSFFRSRRLVQLGLTPLSEISSEPPTDSAEA